MSGKRNPHTGKMLKGVYPKAKDCLPLEPLTHGERITALERQIELLEEDVLRIVEWIQKIEPKTAKAFKALKPKDKMIQTWQALALALGAFYVGILFGVMVMSSPVTKSERKEDRWKQ